VTDGIGRVVHRLPVLLLLVAVLSVAGLVDHSVRRPRVASRTVSAGMPQSAPADALSSTWYCVGGSSGTGTPNDTSFIVANAGGTPRKGTITIVSAKRDTRRGPLDVPAAGRVVVRAQDLLKGPWVAATIELDGGATAAEVTVAGSLGDSVSPCASAASDHWYFAEGVTTKDAGEALLLYNAFPEDAIVDISFFTEEGKSVPQGLQGLAIPGRQLTIVPVQDFVHRRQQAAAVVATRVGRIVAARVQVFDGTGGRKGQALTLGAPSPEHTWWFPEGLVTNGLTERYQLFNPTNQEVRASLGFSLEQGAAEPIDVTVPAQSRVTVSANDEKRIPRQVAHAVTVTADGRGLVVERVIDAVPPAPRAGFSAVMGATTLADRWLLAAGQADDAVDEWVVLDNPTRRSVTVNVIALAAGQRLPIEGLQELTLAPGQRSGLRLGDHIKRPDLPVLVQSTGPIAVERDLYKVKGLGTAMAIGIPLQ
jgi:hypothetical protein